METEISLKTSFIKKLPKDAKILMVSDENCPIELIELLHDDSAYAVRYIIAKNPNCPIEILEKYSKDRSKQVRCAIGGNPALPLSYLQSIFYNNTDNSIEVLNVLAGNPSLSPELKNRVLKKIVIDLKECTGNAETLAGDPDIGLALVKKISKSGYWQYRAAVAKRPDLTQEIIEILAADSDCDITDRLLDNSNIVLTHRTFEILSTSEAWKARQRVAEHPDCPADILIQISEKDDDGDVLMSMLRNKRCPLEAVVILTRRDENEDDYNMPKARASARGKLTRILKSGGEFIKEKVEGMKVMLDLGIKLSASDSVVDLSEINI